MEEGVVQDSESENLVAIDSHHALASAHGRLNKMGPIRSCSHERVDKPDSRKVSGARSANGMDLMRGNGLHGP